MRRQRQQQPQQPMAWKAQKISSSCWHPRLNVCRNQKEQCSLWTCCTRKEVGTASHRYLSTPHSRRASECPQKSVHGYRILFYDITQRTHCHCRSGDCCATVLRLCVAVQRHHGPPFDDSLHDTLYCNYKCDFDCSFALCWRVWLDG